MQGVGGGYTKTNYRSHTYIRLSVIYTFRHIANKTCGPHIKVVKMSGQNFVFHGYLPVAKRDRITTLRKLEQDAYRKDQTQIFIETPYRNMNLLESILETCSPDSRLCIAVNITTVDEMIITRSITQWKKQMPAIHKQPAVFLLYK